MGISFGIVALLLALIANHASDIYDSGDWFVLDYISDLTYDAKSTQLSIAEIRQGSNSLFIISEKNAIIWCYIFSILFTIISILSTYYSVQIKEHSFFIANSFMFTLMTIFLLNKIFSVLFIFAFFKYRAQRQKI